MSKVISGFDRVLAEVKLDKLIDDMSYEEKKNIVVALKFRKIVKEQLKPMCTNTREMEEHFFLKSLMDDAEND